MTVNSTLEGLWRYSVRDAFCAAPTFALVPPDGTSRRFSRIEQQLVATWPLNPYVGPAAAYVHFEPGAFPRAAHATSEDFGMFGAALRF